MEMKLGYKKSETGILPKDWAVKQLGDIGDVKMCRRIFNHETTLEGEVPFYKIGTFGSDPDAYISRRQYEEYIQRFSFPRKGEVLISAAGTIGRTIVYNGEDAYYQDSNIVWIDNNFELVSNEYLYHVLQVAKYQTEGGTIQRLYNSILKSTKFACPNKAEQTAIATALSDMDNLIAGLETLIEKKKAIKQGAMQELLRPKEGWVVKRLGECLLKSPDYGINAAAVSYSDTLPTYIRITDISNDGRFLSGNKTSVNHPLSDKYCLEENDIVFARTGASVGKTYLYNKEDGRLVYAGFLIRVKPDPRFLNSIYLQNFTTTQKYWNWVSLMSMRSGQPGINGNEFAQLEIPIPATIEEQNEIAHILSEMDSEIHNLKLSLSKYASLKQGMMHELLTGKTRLV